MDFKLNEEQAEIKRAVREFAEKEFTPELALEFDQKEDFPMSLYKKAAQLGITSMRIPQEYGGQGYGVLEDCLAVEEMCRVDPGIGVAISLRSLMIPDLLLKHGTEEQKSRYIPPLAKGEKIAAAAFTEPEHGSDITRMNTTATKTGSEWTINGAKEFITNATTADFLVALVQTDTKIRPT